MGLIGSLRSLIPAVEVKGQWGSEFVSVQNRDTPPDSSIAGFVSRLSPTQSAVWKPYSIRSALGVPSIFGAVSLISATVGALSLEAFRNGVKLSSDQRPRLIVRPDPFRTPRDFFRDTAWNMASRGEAIWWIAARDVDGSAMSVLNIPPHEVSISWNLSDLRYPIITWRGQRIPNGDIVHLTYHMEPGELRGVGPLQLCGAAVSVAVEAQEFAANFYGGGGYPSILIKTANELSPSLDDQGLSEADHLRQQWQAAPNNVPRVIDPSVDDVKQFDPTPQGAHTLDSRDYQNGETARMFSIPGSLLEYGYKGQSLTYQNVTDELDKFTRICLWPKYLEPIEQAMSDLLTRSTVARFNVDALIRADPLTRYQVYQLGIASGVITAEYAQTKEGILPGDVEVAAVPFAPPAAVPAVLPVMTNTAIVGVAGPNLSEPRSLPERPAELRVEDVPTEAVRSGPEPIVSRAQVLSARAWLQAQGKPSGHTSIARHLNVSESTVRRRLANAA